MVGCCEDEAWSIVGEFNREMVFEFAGFLLINGKLFFFDFIFALKVF